MGGARDAAGGHPRPDRRTRLELATQEHQAAAPTGAARAVALIRALPRSWHIAVIVASIALAAACFVRFGVSGRAAVGAVFATVLVLLSAIDLDCRLLPNVIVLPVTALFLVVQIALYPDHALEWVLASFLAAVVLFLPLLVVPTGMGMGDVKLAAMLGAVLGTSVVVAILIGVLAGGVFALALLIRGGVNARKTTFAYGPFLALGGIVVLLLGGH